MSEKTCFNAYDIRGIYPVQINEELGYRIGNALVTKFGFQKIGIGRDTRESGPQLKESLIQGIVDAGASVEDWDYTTTDEMYYGSVLRELSGGVMITSSHNPREYNGFKFVYGNASPLGAKGEMQELEEYVKTHEVQKAEKKGERTTYDLSNDYINKILQLIPPEKLARKLKIVIDASNGVAGLIAQKLFSHLPKIELVPINFEPDGRFPNHPPNPIQSVNSEQIKNKIQEEKADAGFIFDGDGDRVFVVDDQGNWIDGAIAGGMIALDILESLKNARIACNTVTSQSFRELVDEHGGTCFVSPVGHNWMKALMREKDCIYGSEHSGHFYFKDFYYLDSAFVAMMHILSLMNKETRPISEITKDLNPYFQSGEINFTVADKKKLMDEIKEKYQAETQFTEGDGYTFQAGKLWFNVRPSNNEPLLRLNVEGDSKEKVDRIVQDITHMIKSDTANQRFLQ